jgi:hypothetical protein
MRPNRCEAKCATSIQGRTPNTRSAGPWRTLSISGARLPEGVAKVMMGPEQGAKKRLVLGTSQLAKR